MRKIAFFSLAFAGLLITRPSVAQEHSLTIKSKPANSSFCYLDSSPADAASCAKGTGIIVADWTNAGTAYTWRSFLKIDMSSLPAGAIVDTVLLSLYANPGSPSGNPGNPTWGTNNAVGIYRALAAWDTASVIWSTQPAFTSVNSVTLPQSTSTVQNYLNVNVTALVQDMLTNGNNGFVFKHLQETTPLNSMIFYSSNEFPVDSTVTPTLVIKYRLPSGIAMVNNESSLDLYPNPATTSVNISMTKEPGEQLSITIMDYEGRTMTTKKISNNSSKVSVAIDLHDYARGLYIVRVSNSNGNIVTRKLTID